LSPKQELKGKKKRKKGPNWMDMPADVAGPGTTPRRRKTQRMRGKGTCGGERATGIKRGKDYKEGSIERRAELKGITLVLKVSGQTLHAGSGENQDRKERNRLWGGQGRDKKILKENPDSKKRLRTRRRDKTIL